MLATRWQNQQFHSMMTLTNKILFLYTDFVIYMFFSVNDTFFTFFILNKLNANGLLFESLIESKVYSWKGINTIEGPYSIGSMIVLGNIPNFDTKWFGVSSLMMNIPLVFKFFIFIQFFFSTLLNKLILVFLKIN